LSAHARQFSCFMLLLGRIGPGNTFEPKQAILLENKDDLRIPILLETLPTPKEFKDAIESLSPEQQRFAKAFRSMQLEGTVFGLLTIQLKPQLEKLLKLPNDSLTKEIKLTQDLLELFTKYQIPSDLLTYDGDSEADLETKLGKVKEHVKAIMDMLEATKSKELDETVKEFVQNEMEDTESYSGPRPNLACLLESGPQARSVRCAGPARAFSFGSAAKKRSARLTSMNFGCAESAPPPPPASMAVNECALLDSRAEMFEIQANVERSGNQPEIIKQSQTRSEENDEPTIEKKRNVNSEKMEIGESGDSTAMDFTKVPSILDKKFEKLDTESCLKPTILNVGETWRLKHFKSLRSKVQERFLDKEEQKDEKTKCFDLLDAMSCSGSLPVDCATLHVIVAATHCFDETIINTIIQKNVNPIEKVERSTLIVASTIHDKQPAQMIKAQHLASIQSHSPQLVGDNIQSIE